MTEPPPPPPGSSFVYGGMIAVGALLATLCGGCTLYFGGTTVSRMLTSHVDSGLTWVVFALLVGGLPTLGGLILVREGLRGLRRVKTPPQ